MKTSIFDATFTLPPLIEMTDIDKDLAGITTATYATWMRCCDVYPATHGRWNC